MQIQMVQADFTVGAIAQNAQLITEIANQADVGQVLVFPELALTGYPPEDLLLRPDLIHRVEDELIKLQALSADKTLIIGHPHQEAEKLYNAASVFQNGQLLHRYFKQSLPNYGVFDEKRYFANGEQAGVVNIHGHKVGLLICEDLWTDQPIAALEKAGAELVLSLNASPFNSEKQTEREQLISQRAQDHQMPIVYVNHVCGQDELVFDGGSFAVDSQGQLVSRIGQFKHETRLIRFIDGELKEGQVDELADSEEAEMYQALVLSVRDYVNKNGFSGAVLGLSGGIDSALTLAIAVDALGSERVQALMMPFKYTAQMSVEDAKAQAELMDIEFDVVSIEPMFNAFMGALNPMFADAGVDTTEENLQARCRGVILMALSNKKHRIVLTTGNKSEMAVGYATLYGDMAGGFAAIKDVPKTMVYRLSTYRNTISPVIPQRVIDRPPSAELAPDQVDQDSLPDYDTLDAILSAYVENDMSVADIVGLGYDETIVRKVMRLVDINEYKRRQAAVGPKVTLRNFDKDRRYPITSGFGKEH